MYFKKLKIIFLGYLISKYIFNRKYIYLSTNSKQNSYELIDSFTFSLEISVLYTFIRKDLRKPT